MDDINLNDYDEMGTSIEKIKNPISKGKFNPLLNNGDRELFADLETHKKNNVSMQCNNTKNFNMNNFIKDIEDNLDNFDNADSEGPSASNNDFKHLKETFIESLADLQDKEDDSSSEEEEIKEENGWNIRIHKFLFGIREPIIIVLLFVLLNNEELINLINRIPYVNELEPPFPSLIIRGLIFALIIYLLRKMEYSTLA
jgi:hypothetical protein